MRIIKSMNRTDNRVRFRIFNVTNYQNNYEYNDPYSNKALLHAINPSLVLMDRNICSTVQKYDNEFEDLRAT